MCQHPTHEISVGAKIDLANCKCPVIARLVDVPSPKTTLPATTTPAPTVSPTPPPAPSSPMPSLPPLPPFRSSVADLEGKIRGIAGLNSGQGNKAIAITQCQRACNAMQKLCAKGKTYLFGVVNLVFQLNFRPQPASTKHVDWRQRTIERDRRRPRTTQRWKRTQR